MYNGNGLLGPLDEVCFYSNSVSGDSVTLNSYNVQEYFNKAVRILKGNKENNMEIGKKELFKIVLRETVVKHYTHEVMAKDKEDALEIIKNGCSAYSSETISVDVVEVV